MKKYNIFLNISDENIQILLKINIKKLEKMLNELSSWFRKTKKRYKSQILEKFHCSNII